ncbi:flavodoxin-dependent (E)-4-hydroxy-3-methylbut-2-enyl-diphosphate synthase [Ruminococcus sp.]|uniref:flavodoxin-dependent (E)-4-hydroxy-3-methylbut-2-enyl-diphosphate synthase n=1 Tax=Ruminococcus sp. TaxID=41978 RepID=UPI0025D3295B|nr:flavodoxin-dependent (E)-4-hydroxy-3-methylbut-2-enyl-diphosphate synthase [Ruminococcus sp.]MCI5817136.1 flavodoxin-dependent (E)-4-hydroxy-3-methylbut-2-enyl-diphosphate synthase [Ruminococcus sp.]MDD7557024.1 flavodoxin-dependent (E)-4-hydroxy-3-methylbut-2-enyl-diphosphate synthase [Ruminococcus sp.]MDY4963989.1 flavodoxin-dependent (E)-4-hydroxy-3-methylbut-2-enyl-diphosphate synthase [Ruminococcus callidus]
MRTVKPVKVGDCLLDGKHIYIQSMLNRRSDDIAGSVEQALALEQAGCEIVRAAIPDMDAVRLVGALKEKLHIPLVADIHFDYRLAIEAAAAGVDKIRINPGNIGDMDRVRQVVEACKSRQIPIRIGVNSGSLEKELLAKYGAPTPEALVESAMGHVAMLNRFDFDDIVISIKSSDVPTMIRAYRLAAQACPYPLHLGVTEAGTERMGLIKSAIGIGALLADDIGETIRVSLTDDPIKEIAAARDILKGVGKRSGVQIVSCPTCGRTRIDLVRAAKEVEAAVANLDKDIKIAVMGCIVNGPGEAREADIGVAGGDGCAVIFKKDQCLRKIPESEIVPELLKEIEKL